MFDMIKSLLSGALEFVTEVEELKNRVEKLEAKLSEPVNTTENVDAVVEEEVKEPEQAEQLQLEFTTEEPEQTKVPALKPRQHFSRKLHEIAVGMYKDGRSYEEISLEINVPAKKVRDHIYKTVIYPDRPNKDGVLVLGEKRGWDDVEESLAYEMRRRGCSLKEIAERLKRTVHSVSKKLSKINNGVDSLLNPDGTVKTKA